MNWIYHIPLHKTQIYVIAVRDDDIDDDQDYGAKQKKAQQTTQLQLQIHACTVLVFLSVFTSFIFIYLPTRHARFLTIESHLWGMDATHRSYQDHQNHGDKESEARIMPRS